MPEYISFGTTSRSTARKASVATKPATEVTPNLVLVDILARSAADLQRLASVDMAGVDWFYNNAVVKAMFARDDYAGVLAYLEKHEALMITVITELKAAGKTIEGDPRIRAAATRALEQFREALGA